MGEGQKHNMLGNTHLAYWNVPNMPTFFGNVACCFQTKASTLYVRWLDYYMERLLLPFEKF